jgi:hypothetical protein
MNLYTFGKAEREGILVLEWKRLLWRVCKKNLTEKKITSTQGLFFYKQRYAVFIKSNNIISR